MFKKLVESQVIQLHTVTWSTNSVSTPCSYDRLEIWLKTKLKVKLQVTFCEPKVILNPFTPNLIIQIPLIIQEQMCEWCSENYSSTSFLNSPYCMIYLWWETERENHGWSVLGVKGLILNSFFRHFFLYQTATTKDNPQSSSSWCRFSIVGSKCHKQAGCSTSQISLLFTGDIAGSICGLPCDGTYTFVPGKIHCSVHADCSL